MHVLVRDRSNGSSAAALGAAALLPWLGLVRLGETMGFDAFMFGWTVMMAAMMLPSIAPLVLLYRRSRAVLALGCVAVWSGLVWSAGVGAWAYDIELAGVTSRVRAGDYLELVSGPRLSGSAPRTRASPLRPQT